MPNVQTAHVASTHCNTSIAESELRRQVDGGSADLHWRLYIDDHPLYPMDRSGHLTAISQARLYKQGSAVEG